MLDWFVIVVYDLQFIWTIIRLNIPCLVIIQLRIYSGIWGQKIYFM